MPSGTTHSGPMRSGSRTRRATGGGARTSRSGSSSRSASDRSGKSARDAQHGSHKTSEKGSQKAGAGTGFVDDGRLYYRIGEVSRITGVKPYVLRYWETEFRWMSPQKSRSKQRLYRAKDIETILLIKRLLYEERYTIAGARRRLRELGAARSGKERPMPDTEDPREQLGRVRKELQAVRDMLEQVGPRARR